MRKVRCFFRNLYRCIFFWKIKSFSIADCVSIFSCSFSPHGWHHLTKTLEQVLREPSTNYKDTPLYFFHSRFCPKGIHEIIPNLKKNTELPFLMYPWGFFSPCPPNKKQEDSRFCGPSSEAFIKNEFDETVKLLKMIQEKGYNPWKYDFVTGTILVKSNGQKKFVVTQGNHRVAALAALGKEKILIRVDKRISQEYVYERDVNNWRCVQEQRLTPEEALHVFNYFFTHDGKQIKDIIYR